MIRKTTEPKFNRLTGAERRSDLIEAGLSCMARGGIQEFTVDRICAEAGISRGMITHYFGSINGLLAAVYAKVYRDTLPDTDRIEDPAARVAALIDSYFDPKIFTREKLNIWIALWGQISVNPELGAEHRRQYRSYHQQVAGAIAALAAARGRQVAAPKLAKALICLVDGLRLEHCLDPDAMPISEARDICLTFLAPYLGKEP